MTNVATTSKNGVARPLKVLVPIIKSEIKLGFQAGQRHWLTVGRLLNEARKHWEHDNSTVNGLTFHDWVHESFAHPMSGEPLARTTVKDWMRGAREVGPAAAATRASVTAVTRKESPFHEDYKPELDWKAGVRKVQQTVNVDALARELHDRKAEEREMHALAKKIITAGYRALAAVVHPDKPGGSAEAMKKLTKARNWLEEVIER